MLIICKVLGCNDSVLGHVNVVLLWILNVLIYSETRRRNSMWKYCVMLGISCAIAEWGYGFSRQIKCHIILGKGGRRIVKQLTLHLKTTRVSLLPLLKACLYSQLLKNTTWSSIIEKTVFIWIYFLPMIIYFIYIYNFTEGRDIVVINLLPRKILLVCLIIFKHKISLLWKQAICFARWWVCIIAYYRHKIFWKRIKNKILGI